MQLLSMVTLSLVLVFAGAAARAQSISAPQSPDEPPFECHDGMCTCSSLRACDEMAESGVCGKKKAGDMTCSDKQQTCECMIAREGPTARVRPAVQTPATHNANAPVPDRRDHRRPASKSAGQDRMAPKVRVGAQALTAAECGTLGGKLTRLSVCGSSGLGGLADAFGASNACVTTDHNGKSHAVCLEKAAKSSSHQTPPSRPRGQGSTVPAIGPLATPLTSQECKGLGGTITSTYKCLGKGQQTCATADKHGVVRVACIDEVAAD